MRCSKNSDEVATSAFRSERGSATLETITLGTLLLVPIVYLVLALGAIQAGTLAAEGAARHAARAFVQADAAASASDRAERAIITTLADYGFSRAQAAARIACAPSADCLTRGNTVTIELTLRVPLPLIPAIDASTPFAVAVEAAASQTVSRFWGAR
ncbi:hypothetical protein [Ruicaihuangia caeni]|uniref:hypothetical protein n=1 Tax=Ruicaihuangia caeni TaxID=3042517 RepID=UPI00338F7439